MLDVLIFIIILLFMSYGYKRGFEATFPGTIIIICALVLSIVFNSVVAAFLNSTALPEIVGGWATNSFMSKISLSEIDSGTVHQIYGSLTRVENQRVVIGEIFIKFMALLVVMVALYFVLKGVFKKYGVFKKVKVVMQINPALGGVVGIFNGLICVYIVFALLAVSEPMIPTQAIRNQVSKSEIAKYVYEENYIANIIARREYLSSEG